MKRVSCAASLALLAAVVCGCSADNRSDTADVGAQFADATQLQYVGSQRCAQCHADEYDRWGRSHHARAMAPANADSVRGNFDSSRFDYGEFFAEFFTRDDRYWLRTNDLPRGAQADSDVVEFQVRYTFGFDPLQQYLVDTGGGRLQAFNIAASTAQASSAWFDLYPGQRLDRTDPLQWSSELHNWNSRCAACHVTAFDKRFDAAAQTYSSDFAEVHVGCEACHGRGSAHVGAPSVRMPVATAFESRWAFVDGPVAVRQTVDAASDAARQVQACAACHSRRAQFAPHEAGGAYLDAFEPAWLSEGLYYPDGQILDEVFVFGSFAQSAMYAAGVGCTDCHEPHSGELRASGDALCAQCHRADVFGAPTHHRHDVTPQPACVDCHMPATTYMQIDPRRDHSFRVPRPDLTVATGSPNACNGCHDDRDAAWAQAHVDAWFPQGRSQQPHYGHALAAGRAWGAQRRPALLALVYDTSIPGIVRATALRLLARQLDGAVLDAIEFATRSDEPMLQLAGLQSLESAEARDRIQLAQRFLDDSSLVLRINAARILVGAQSGLSERRREDFRTALAQYEQALTFNADSAEGLLGVGVLAAQRGDSIAAEQSYRAAIRRNPAFAAAHINLSDLLRARGDESAANAVLVDALAGPAAIDPGLHVALGFSWVRLERNEEAVAALQRATELGPEDPYYLYAYGIALASVRGRDAALEYLAQAHLRKPGYAPILVALATMNRDAGNLDVAADYTARLLELSPGDPVGVALERELGAAQAAAD